jgi:WD40 repeat protein
MVCFLSYFDPINIYIEILIDMQWSPINDLLVTASSDASIRIWQISKGKCMRVIESTPGIENLCCCFHPSNNNFIAVGNNRGILQMYNVSTGKALKVLICFNLKRKNELSIIRIV